MFVSAGISIPGAGLFLWEGNMEYSEIDLWVSIEQILTPDEFRIFEMRNRGHMTQQQIADEIGVQQPTINEQLEKITKKVKESL